MKTSRIEEMAFKKADAIEEQFGENEDFYAGYLSGFDNGFKAARDLVVAECKRVMRYDEAGELYPADNQSINGLAKYLSRRFEYLGEEQGMLEYLSQEPIKESEIAALVAEFEVAESTVRRWMTGKARPAPRIQAQIGSFLAELRK